MKNLLGLIVMVVVVVSCSFSKKATNSNSTANSNNATKTETSTATNGTATLTRAKYEQVQMGMTYDEVVKIIGPGTESERYTANSAEVVKYKWAGDNHARITGTFSNGKLSFKTRANLK
jgi:outer membrane protein assembly factor BamE (lipoprotein component of BamABCDE complex)